MGNWLICVFIMYLYKVLNSVVWSHWLGVGTVIWAFSVVNNSEVILCTALTYILLPVHCTFRNDLKRGYLGFVIEGCALYVESFQFHA